MRPRLRSPDLEHELAEAVDHRGHRVEAGGDVDEARRLHPALDAVEIAELGSQRREDRESRQPPRARSGADPERATDVAGRQDSLAVHRPVAADVSEPVVHMDPLEEEVDSGRSCEGGGQLDAELGEAVVDGTHALGI